MINFMIQFCYLDRIMQTVDHFKKWTSLKVAVIFIISLVLLQCKSVTRRIGDGELAEIDVTKDYLQKEFYLQDIAKVEYIPFETNDNAIMGRSVRVFYVSEDYIITANTSEGDIFVYDGIGKWKYSFNHKGQGPGEYIELRNIAFDEKSKELFVCERYSSNSKILVYAENGEYKRTLLCPLNFWPTLYNFDDETLLVYEDYGVYEMEGYSNKPYWLMSKKDGSFTDSLDIYLPVRLSNVVVWYGTRNGQTMMFARAMGINYNNRSYGKSFLIADWSADTIYRLTPQKELQPIIVRKPPMQSTNHKILWSNVLATDKFILLGVYEMNYEAVKNGNSIEQKQLMYDFTSGEINVYKLKNKDITSSDVSIKDAITPVNIGITMYDTSFLFDLNEKGELQGELKELLKSLDEEDNPVLVKIKF